MVENERLKLTHEELGIELTEELVNGLRELYNSPVSGHAIRNYDTDHTSFNVYRTDHGIEIIESPGGISGPRPEDVRRGYVEAEVKVGDYSVIVQTFKSEDRGDLYRSIRELIEIVMLPHQQSGYVRSLYRKE